MRQVLAVFLNALPLQKLSYENCFLALAEDSKSTDCSRAP